MQQTHILKTKRELAQSLPEMRKTLKKIALLSYWKLYLKNYGFKFEDKKFNWDYWQTIPFLTPSILNTSSLQARLADIHQLFKKNPYRFFLNKSPNSDNIYINFIPNLKQLPDQNWKILFSRSHMLHLNRVLISLVSKQKNTLILENKMEEKLKPILDELKVKSITINPKDIIDFEKNLYNIKMKKTVKDVTLTNLNLKRYKMKTIQDLFSEARFRINFPYIGAFLYCPYVKKRYGLNAVHIGEKVLVEILNSNSNGWGEIIITRIYPYECSFIRLKTGYFGRAIFEKCRCGEKWALIPVEASASMKPLKFDLDYIINMKRKL